METTPNNPEHEMDSDSLFRRTGVLIILVVFVGFGLWAALAPLSSAALAPGVIQVESYRKTIQHLEGGIIKSINVRNGEHVTAYHILFVLDDTQPKSQLQVLTGQYYISLAREARLLAQQKNLETIVFPEELTNTKDSRSKEAIAMQMHNFLVRKNANEGENTLYTRQIEQLKARGEGLLSQKRSRWRLVNSYRAELSDFQELLKEGYAEKQRVREYQRNLAESEGSLGELGSSIAETNLQISEIELQQLQLNKVFQREVATELSEVQIQLFDLREQIRLLRDTVSRTIVRAPVHGMIMDLNVHTIGAVIPPGGKLLDIVPEGEALIIEARVSPMDIDRVSVGQAAEIRLSVFKARDVPKIEGTVVSLSADRMVDENTQDPEPYYLARLEITEEGVKELYEAHLDLKPGMPAEVLIITGDRTMLEYLFDPLSDTISHSFIED